MARKNPPTVQNLWKLQVRRTNYIKGCLDKWMESSSTTGTGKPFDAVISPTSPYSACPHGTFGWVAYTAMWNLCDQTSCVFPVTKVDPEIDVKEGYEGRNDIEKSIWERCKSSFRSVLGCYCFKEGEMLIVLQIMPKRLRILLFLYR